MSNDYEAPHAVGVILAAGLGKRFHSDVPKVLHRAAGKPLIEHVVASVSAARSLGRVLVVIGPSGDQVVESLRSYPDLEFVMQPERLGTGDAVKRCQAALTDFDGDVLVVSGDGPLIRTDTVEELIQHHSKEGAAVSLLTARLDDPTGYGRIIRNEEGKVTGIVEEADADISQSSIDEVSTGVWCFNARKLFEALGSITTDNAQGELYLPDAAMVIADEIGHIYTLMAKDPLETKGVNNRSQLAEAAAVIRARIVQDLMDSGVTVEDPATTYIDAGVKVGRDTVIRPMTFLEGETVIGMGCSIGPSTRIVDSTVEDGAEVTFAVVRESVVGTGASVGPFASLRPGSVLGPSSKIGTFVETKAATIGSGSKVPHLSYIGDAEIGEDSNIGAGTITCNYDGETKTKSKTVIGDDVLIGSDTMLVAPLTIEDGAVSGAGSVITKDVGIDDVVVGSPARTVRKRKPRKK